MFTVDEQNLRSRMKAHLAAVKAGLAKVEKAKELAAAELAALDQAAAGDVEAYRDAFGGAVRLADGTQWTIRTGKGEHAKVRPYTPRTAGEVL